MTYSKSQKEASRKYNEKHYARIGLYLPPDEKERWQAEADRQGVTLSEFIKQCVREKIDT